MNKKFSKKLDFARRITEQRILETVTNDDFYREDPHLITVLSTTLNEDDIISDEDNNEEDAKEDDQQTDKVRSRKGKFLEEIENKVDQNNPAHIERLNHVKLQVMDHLKVTKTRKNRSRTDSKRKGTHGEDEEREPHSSRPRTISPK